MLRLDIRAIIKHLGSDLEIDSDTIQTVLHRYEHEGFSFLSVTLPKFSKAVIAGVANGRLNDECCPASLITAFAWRTWTRVPTFMEVQLRKLFSRNGTLRADYDPRALHVIRQFCEYFYKTATAFKAADLEAAEDKFVAVDASVGKSVDNSWVDVLRKRLETHYHLTESFDAIIAENKPRLTSGSFAGTVAGMCGNVHYAVYKRSQLGLSVYPHSASGAVGAIKPRRRTTFREWLIPYIGRKPRQLGSRPCEVLFVPKDSRGPRTIAKEPLHTLKWQMSYFDYLSTKLEKVTRKRVLFYDQSIHRELARLGSIDGSWATMDLKDASDRVSVSVVRHLFRNLPIRKFLDFRSSVARLPSSHEIILNKLSGMGSGLTFPTMALLIHLTVCESISQWARIPFDRCMKLVYVYGDDLIVPSKYAFLVDEALSRVGLELNREKSFAKGPFRESCGADFLKGVYVTPVRLKLSGADIPNTTKVTQLGYIPVKKDIGVLQLERHCRELIKADLFNLAEYFYGRIERKLGRLPFISGDCPLLGRYTLDIRDVLLQTYKGLKGWVVRPTVIKPRRLQRRSLDGNFHYDATVADEYYAMCEALRPTIESEPVIESQRGVGVPRTGYLKRTPVDTTRCLGSEQVRLVRSCCSGGIRIL